MQDMREVSSETRTRTSAYCFQISNCTAILRKRNLRGTPCILSNPCRNVYPMIYLYIFLNY